MDELISESDFDKQRAAVAKKIKGMNTKVAKEITKEKERRDDSEVKVNVMTAEKIFNESIDMYRDGDMEWDEMVKDLVDTLKKI